MVRGDLCIHDHLFFGVVDVEIISPILFELCATQTLEISAHSSSIHVLALYVMFSDALLPSFLEAPEKHYSLCNQNLSLIASQGWLRLTDDVSDMIPLCLSQQLQIPIAPEKLYLQRYLEIGKLGINLISSEINVAIEKLNSMSSASNALTEQDFALFRNFLELFSSRRALVFFFRELEKDLFSKKSSCTLLQCGQTLDW
jgi:hypothetical protein